MTYTGTERLIRRIVDSLNKPENLPSQTHLAQEYSETCRLVHMRLEQCGALLNEGNELQAVQLAEVEPALLDLVRLLGFREAPAWIQYCEENKLPIPVQFDVKLISKLNQAYAKGITPDHPLIRDYREAVLRRQDIPAMTALRSILRLNPSDQNAQSELIRLEKKILIQKLDSLASLLSGGSEEAITGQVDEIEALGFKAIPSGPVFDEGVRRRSEYLSACALADAQAILLQIAPLQVADKWEPAEPMLNRIDVLKSEHSFEFPPAEAAQWKRAQDWLSSRKKDNQRAGAFQNSCRELIQTVEQCDDRQATQKQMTTAQIRSDLELLVKKYRTVTDFGLPIPSDIEGRYRKRYGILKSQVEKKQNSQRVLVAAVAFVATVVCVAIGYFVHSQQEAGSLVDEMAKLRAGRQVSAAESFLKDLPGNAGGYLNLPSVSAAKDQTEAFVKEEHARNSKLEVSLTSLEAAADKQFQGSEPDLIQKEFDEAGNQEKQLAKDFQPSVESRLLSFQNKWESFLLNYHDLHAQQFAAKLAELEETAKSQLDFNRKPEDLLPVVGAMNDKLTKLGAETSTQIPQLKLGDDLLARFSDLQTKIAPFQKSLAEFAVDQSSARTASTLDAYLKALQSLSQSELVASPAVVNAKRVIDIAPTSDKLTGGLLMPDNNDGWAFVTSNPHAPFYPTSNVLDPEKQIYDQVTVDPNLHSVYQYTLQGAVDSSTLLVQGQLTGAVDGETLSTKVITDYRPAVNPDKLVFTQEGVSGRFTSQGETYESQAFRNWNFSGLINDAGTNFVGGTADAPIHQMLDQIVQDPKASSIFKGYILYNLGQLVSAGKREPFWGMQYSPSLRQVIDDVNRLSCPGSGDWMVPSIAKAKKKSWDDLLSKYSKISFLKQAQTLRASYLRVNQTGFDYVGFVDENGAPQLLQGRGTIPQLWGWAAQNTTPALLFTSSGDDKEYKPVVSAAPMTPLFQFKGDQQAILQLVRQDQRLTDQEFANSVEPFLPAFFGSKSGKPGTSPNQR